MIPSDYLDGFIHYYLFNISCSGTGILKAICVYSKQLENTFRFIKNFFRNFIFFSAKRQDVVFKLSVLEIKKKIKTKFHLTLNLYEWPLSFSGSTYDHDVLFDLLL